MKMRADQLAMAVGELRTGLLAVRRFTDTLLSTLDGTSSAAASKVTDGRSFAARQTVCLDRKRSDRALIAFALVTILTLALRKP